MINSKDLFRDLKMRITLMQDATETDSLLYLILESIAGLTRSDVIAQKPVSLTNQEITTLNDVLNRVNKHEPVQYILGMAHFYGHDFIVNPSVLIPRPETELVVEEVLKHASSAPGKILDIGTGSGCIAITLADRLPQKDVIAFDISEGALQTASANARRLNAKVEFQQVDILNATIPFQDLEVIVSNPPYVAASEKETMNANVLNHEPHLALFVPDHDPLIFYNVIAQKGYTALKSGGRVVTEINERFGKDVTKVFFREGYQGIRVIKDLQGKDRIVSAIKP